MTDQCISAPFEWAYESNRGSNSNGYFVFSTRIGIMLATDYPKDVIGVSISPYYSITTSVPTQSMVGLLGIVKVRDDGTCTPGFKCTVKGGIATPGDNWLVINRLDPQMITIMFK